MHPNPKPAASCRPAKFTGGFTNIGLVALAIVCLGFLMVYPLPVRGIAGIGFLAATIGLVWSILLGTMRQYPC